MRKVFLVFCLIGVLIFSLNSGAVNCDSGLMGGLSIPQDKVKLRLNEPLNYDLEVINKWISELKAEVILSMLSKTGAFAEHLKIGNGMTVGERKSLSYHVEVRPLEKESRTFVAVFWSDENLNRSQMRTELHAFGGGDAIIGQVPSESTLFLHESCEACRGLNLNGKSFVDFKRTLESQNLQMYPEELAFFQGVIDPLLKLYPDGDFNILSIQAKAAALDTLVHEGHHALFDRDPHYKQILLNYWNTFIKGKEDEIINSSFRSPYSSYSLLIDEFFAYLLQPEVFGQNNPMAKFKEKHFKNVISALEKEGYRPPFL